MLPNQKKKLGLAGIGLYTLVIAVVVARAVIQAKNRGMLHRTFILIICCCPFIPFSGASMR